jgi:hypothetical protein
MRVKVITMSVLVDDNAAKPPNFVTNFVANSSNMTPQNLT